MKQIESEVLSLCFHRDTPLLALPSWASPRLILSAHSYRHRWRGIRLLDAYSLAGRMRRLAFQWVSPFLIPRCLSGGQELPPVDEFVKELFPRVERKAVVIGRDDARQKWTVAFLDGKGCPVGFLKYGERELARRRILHEAQVLAQLPEKTGPELLKAGEFAKGNAFVMKPVEGKYIKKSPLSDDIQKLVSDWVDRLETGPVVAVAEHPAIVRLREQVTVLGAPSSVLCLPDFEKILAPLRPRCLPVGWQHGDAAPWNLFVSPSAVLSAIDWEDAVADGCPLFDLIYYVLQTHFFLKDAAVHRAFRQSVDWVCRKGFMHAEAAALTKMAALDAWLRWREEGVQDDHPLQLFRIAIFSHII